MSVIKKLLGLWTISNAMSATTPVCMSLLTMSVVMIALVISASILAMMILAGCLWLISAELLANGVDSATVQYIIGGTLLALFAGASYSCYYCWQKIKSCGKHLIALQNPIGGKISNITQSFFDGYNSRKSA